jgi:uncharacterized protein (DUF2126 family)
MSYDNALIREVVPVAIDLSASAADKFTWIMPTGKAIHVKNFTFIAATEVVGDATTAAVVSLDHTPSGDSRAEKCTVTPDNVAIGVEVQPGTAFTAATEFDVVAGDTLIVEHKTQASGGTTTGAGYAVIYYTEINK